MKTHDVINGCIAAAAICAAWTPTAAAHDTAARIVRVDAPAKVWTNSAGRVVADFGRDMFGAPEVVSGADGAEIWVGERLSGDAIDRTPPGSVRAAKLPLAADKRNTGPDAVPLPEVFGVVIPFRYAEYPASAGVELRRRTVVVPMDMSASSFRCSDEKLNRVWDFCKETILATSFAGVYVDGDRERIPYEADAYVNMLGEQAVWADGAMAKATIAWLAEKPTWPTEWSQLYVSLVRGYYMATGDRETFDRHLPLCRRRMRVGRIRKDGLLVRKSGNIVDWPAGERDGYDMDVEVNAVVNAFYWRNLRELCATKEDEYEAERVRASFVRAFLDDASGLVRDGEGSEHHSLHANALALSLGLIPQAHCAKAWAFCKSRGMACSPYFAQFLLEAAFEMDDPAYALSLMTSEDERSWLGMMRAGATMTMEAWNQKAKPNQDWNHAWSTAPLNIAMRKILGVEPLEPGYASVRVRPRLGPLSFAEGRVPTVRGEVSVECRSASLAVTIPRGVRAEVVLPWSGESRSVGEGRHVFSMGDDPASVSTRVARQFLSADPLDYRPEGFRGSGYFAEHGYGDGTAPHYAVVSLWANAIACARKSCDWKTLDELVASFDRFYGEARFAVTPIRHVDFNVFGALPAEVFLASGDRRAAEMAVDFAERQWEKPGPKDAYPWYFELPPLAERMEWWKKGYSSQTRLWIDDMYMITFLQTQAYRITGEKRFVERAAKEMALYLSKIQNPDGLFNHSPEAPFAWARGNGWMAAGMSLLLEYLPEDNPHREAIKAGHEKMMATLLANQRKSGLWGQIVDDRESWDETSGSAMFAYAFQSGVNHGLLDASVYAPAAKRAYLALVSKLDEHANISDVCEGTGPKNSRDHYLGRARVNGDPHGQAPLLWLCSALLDAEARCAVREIARVDYRERSVSTNCWLKLRVPEGRTGFPTLVWFHGGGLTGGKPGFRSLGDDGIAQVAVRYRFLTETDADGCIDDAARAIAWTLDHIAEYGGDPKKVFVAGHSAGGYLTLMAGLDASRLAKYGHTPEELAGLVPVSGQVTKHFAVRSFSGDKDPQYLPKIDALAPLYYSNAKSAPLMLITGDRRVEFPCRVEENEFMAVSMKRLGRDDVWFREYPGRTHGSVAPAANQAMRDFVRRLSAQTK